MTNVIKLKTYDRTAPRGPRTRNLTPAPRGNNLRKLRLAAGLTVDETIKDMGVCTATLQHWELGRVRPQRNNMVRLAECYRVHTDQPKWASDKVEPIKTSITKLHLQTDEELQDFLATVIDEANKRGV